MAQVPRPWRLFIVVLGLAAAVVGFLEYERRQELAIIADLQAQIQAASSKVNTLRAREKKLDQGQPGRDALLGFLLDPDEGTAYAQRYLALVQAGRFAGVKLGRLTFAPHAGVGNAEAVVVTGLVSGKESELVGFFRRLETGRPIGQVEKLSWSLTTVKGEDPSGQAVFQLLLFGPVLATSP